MPRRLTIRCDHFPIKNTFRIARGAKTVAEVIVAEIAGEGTMGREIVGRGEGVPYARYGETMDAAARELAAMADAVAGGLTRDALMEAMRPGAARNALDAALWDWEAKTSGQPVWQLAGLPQPRPQTTAYTISLDTPDAMAKAAAQASTTHPLLKLKLGGDGDLDRVAAVRQAAPVARLIVDANESWSRDHYERTVPGLAELGVELIEQPFPAADDATLAHLARPIAVAADESVHGADSLEALGGRYDVVCLKLDKTGGLTAALAVRRQAEAMGMGIMVGCMVASSLAMAPAVLLAQSVRYVDLDGPLLLSSDRDPGLRYDGSIIHPSDPILWG